jgi:hypothetical protein
MMRQYRRTDWLRPDEVDQRLLIGHLGGEQRPIMDRAELQLRRPISRPLAAACSAAAAGCNVLVSACSACDVSATF